MADRVPDVRHLLEARSACLERPELLEDGDRRPPAVRDVVAASWRRSRSAGVDSGEYRITYHADVDLDSRLVRCARPVIDRLAREMVDVPVAIALSDAHARIVHRLDCSTSVGRPLDRVDFNAGFSFAEAGVGTNGIGTVFEAGTSVAVVGAEHFTEALTRFACTGAPIVDPVTGRVEGVLDVSSLAETWTPLMHALVRRAAADIGENLLADRGRATQALFETFLRADARPRQAVMAVGDSLMVNRRAQQLFTPAEQFALHQHALFLMSRRDRVTESIVLESGRRVRIRATRIVVGPEVAGIVLLLDDETSRDRPPGFVVGGRPVPVASGTARTKRGPATGRRGCPDDGRSPAWVRARTEVTAALEEGEPLLVLGEAGTAKATLVSEQFLRLHPDGRVVAVQVGADGATVDLTDADDAPHTLVLVRRLDRAAAVASLDILLRSLTATDAAAGARVVVAATLDDAAAAEPLPFQALLPHFGASVTVPPLRFRTDDVPLVVARALRELAPGRRVRLHPDAGRLVARHTWPGNLTQLRGALSAALQRRPVGEIHPEDLPAWCRTTSTRTLSTLETAERDAIVAALAECGGNRLHAAAALGMSRSSLYRKIKTYAIIEA